MSKKINEVKKFIYKHRFIYSFLNFGINQINRLHFLLITILTKNRVKFNSFHNIHSGKRCIIVGNGPSLSPNDLDSIKNEICFGTNYIYKVFEKTVWRPTYFVTQDINGISGEELFNYKGITKFLGVYYKRKKKVHGQHETVYYNNYKKLKFSFKPNKVVYDSYTVTFACIQLAVYMGFKEIFLLGIDHKYPNIVDTNGNIISSGIVKSHFHPDDKLVVANLIGMEKAYMLSKKVTNNLGVSIYNITRGGNLEVFERKNIDNVIETGKNVK